MVVDRVVGAGQQPLWNSLELAADQKLWWVKAKKLRAGRLLYSVVASWQLSWILGLIRGSFATEVTGNRKHLISQIRHEGFIKGVGLANGRALRSFCCRLFDRYCRLV